MRGRADASRLGVAAGAVAVVCRASLSAIAGLLGGISVAVASGVAGGMLLAGAASASILLVPRRHRRNCRDVPRPGSDQ